MNKSRRLIVVIVAFLILAMGLGLGVMRWGRRPFKDLEPTEIAFASVRLMPPDKNLKITEFGELAEYLNDVVIYQKDDSYQRYCGQAVVFTLTLTDGTQTDVMAYNPFLVIDGVGYRTRYEPCEALNRYANRLLNETDAVIIQENPPRLDVIIENTCNGTLMGAYSWQCTVGDVGTGTEADSAHPLECRDLMDHIETTERMAMLRFQEEPDEITVCCWSDEHWSDPMAESESISLHGNEIDLKPGGYIYEVTARWNADQRDWGGVVRYSFYVDRETP